MKDEHLFENYKKAVASKNVILLAQSGSEILGLNSAEKSDRDEVGICIESFEDVAGFKDFDQLVYRTAADRTGIFDTPSQPGDIDLTIYGLRKFLRLALGGNPNLIQLLFTPKDKCLIYTDLAKELQELAPHIIAKSTLSAFFGYCQAQKLRLIGSKGQKGIKRPQLEQAHGFDTKYAMHAIRLAIQAQEIAEKGMLQLPMRDNYIAYLKMYKLGKYDFNDAIHAIEAYEERARTALAASTMRNTPDREYVENWLLNTYRNYWSKKND